MQQRRRAKCSDAGTKRPEYKRKKSAREGPLRGLTVAETVGLRVAPKEHFISAIMSEMSPPKRKKRNDRWDSDKKILQETVDFGKNFSATEKFFSFRLDPGRKAHNANFFVRTNEVKS